MARPGAPARTWMIALVEGASRVVAPADAVVVPFTAQTRMSGLDLVVSLIPGF